jgi:hypothetical protein
MSKQLDKIQSTNSFEAWFNITNELVDAVGDTVTIGDGESNVGNVIITGDISSSAVLTDSISLKSLGNSNLDIDVPVTIDSLGDYVVKLNSGENLKNTLRYSSNDVTTWEASVSSDYNSFTIENVGADETRVFKLEENNDGFLEITGTNIKLDVNLLPGQISSNTTGNSDTANKIKTARTISVGGDVTFSFEFDGSQNINVLDANVADNSHKHSIANISGLQDALDSKFTGSVFTTNLTKLEGLGIIVKSDADDVATVNIVEGNGIGVTNGNGIGGNIEIGHGNTSDAADVDGSATGSFVQSIELDEFGHITAIGLSSAIAAAKVSSSTLLINGQQGRWQSFNHGLGRMPSHATAYLQCVSSDATFATGDAYVLQEVMYNSTNVAAYLPTTLRSTINGSQVSYTDTKWRLVLEAWK